MDSNILIMKHFYFLSLFFIYCLVNAQLTIINLSDNSQINDGDVFNFDQLATSPNPNESQGKLKFKITNSSTTESIRVLGQIVSFSNTDGTGSQFCIQPSCFFDMSVGQNIPNNPLDLTPGEDNGNFDSFYNSNPGDGVNYPISYTIRFYMLDDNDQEVGDDIEVTYNYTPENFSNRGFEPKDLGINIKNTIIDEFFNFSANEPISFSLVDISGKKVLSRNLNAGEHQENFSNISNGNYIVVFKNNNGQQSSLRIVIK